MTKEYWAERITWREYGDEFSERDNREACADGIVVIFGGSDDLMELRGAIHDELYVFGGSTVLIHSKGVATDDHERECECDYCGFKAMKAKCAKIEAVWGTPVSTVAAGGDSYSWTYKTGIPHATFEIVEGSEKFCRGIVIDVNDLPTI